MNVVQFAPIGTSIWSIITEFLVLAGDFSSMEKSMVKAMVMVNRGDPLAVLMSQWHAEYITLL